MNHRLTKDDELEIACLVGLGQCRGIDLLRKQTTELRREREKVKSLKIWIKTLDRQIERAQNETRGRIDNDHGADKKGL